LQWRYEMVQPWVVALLERVAAEDPSPRLRATASRGLVRIGDQLARDAAWRQLSEPLRSSIGRHEGKWVVVSAERVISTNRFRGQAAKQARGVLHTRRTNPQGGLESAEVYWVAPASVTQVLRGD
jgi:hypothetical protein